jgi:hypothetical protein
VDKFCRLDGKRKKGRKILNPEIEKTKQINLDKEQTPKKIHDDNIKRIK